MLVRAKWNVKDASGWHAAGDVFETENDLGDAAEVLDQPKAEKRVETPVGTPEEAPVKETKPKTASRRKKISE